jgi:hypothetical protein
LKVERGEGRGKEIRERKEWMSRREGRVFVRWHLAPEVKRQWSVLVLLQGNERREKMRI